MRVSDFNFDLPEELIALRPAVPRSGSRLLHVGDGISDKQFTDIVDLLAPEDCLVVNDTKVIPAQLTGVRPARAQGGGGAVILDVNLHKILPGTEHNARWAAFVRPAKRLKPGDEVRFGDGFSAQVEARDGAEIIFAFNCAGAAFDSKLKKHGHPPLPPYIARKRDVDDRDTQDYQTVYATEEGSVAAPTAGLHFTPEILSALKAKGVPQASVTLHVGAGTFLPVSVENTDDHKMHSEWGEISEETAAALTKVKQAGGRIVAVGTTALRLLESAASSDRVIEPFKDETAIFITPGYKFRAVDRLITNFHLPKSTLFMLVSAFAGQQKMQAAYAHAIANQYRFYSYGDASLLELEK